METEISVATRFRTAFSRRFGAAAAAGGIAALALAGAPAAQAQSGVTFAGKTITIIVGSDVGGGYDAQARLMSRHIGRFLPGNPAVVVQNMPGAGSLLATNFLYNVAAKDGTFFGNVQRGMLTAKLTGMKGVRFDIEKFNWLGNLASEAGVVVAWYTTPFKSADDLFKQEMIVGGTGATVDPETTPRLLNALIGTKFKIVSGYKGTADVNLAMEREEVQGMGDWSWSNVKSRKADYLKEGKIRVLMQVALQKLPDLPNVPSALDYVKNDTDRKVMELFLAQKQVARPVVAPPDIPADRLAALHKAFDAMIKDPQFHADGDKAKLELDPTSADAVKKIVTLVAATPPDIAKRLGDAIEPKK
jgi:tripartite-type tricarboxylate transporter receptor subunit TctC